MSRSKGRVKERAVKYEVVHQRHKGTEAQRHKGTEAQRHKGTEAQEEVHYMSEEEFLERAPDNKVWELRYGELIIHSPVRVKHKSLDIFLSYIIFGYVNAKGLGRVFNSPMAVKFERDLIYEPDIFFVRNTNLGKVEEVIFNGVPDLIVEVISPSMIRHDRGTKFVDYERFGVKEYWILDPQKKQFNFYQLKRGKFKEIKPIFSHLRGEGMGIYKCKEIKGFYVRMDWLKDEKYWSEQNVNKIIYELIGKKIIYELIGKGEIAKDILPALEDEELIDIIGKERLKRLIE